MAPIQSGNEQTDKPNPKVQLCPVCQTKANFTCSGCSSVHYCGREHQKKDWKKHKLACVLYKVERDPLLGRYLKSGLDLKQGQKIFTCLPLAIGPRLEWPSVFCLVCNATLEAKAKISQNNKCNSCQFTFCSKACRDIHKKEDSHDTAICNSHYLECEDLTNLRRSLNKDQNIGYSVILPLRLMRLRQTDPDKFGQLIDLQSHEQELTKGDWEKRWQYIQANVVEPLARHLPGCDEELVTKICGIIITNSFEVFPSGTASGHSLLAVYTLPSLMNHECVGNTRLVIEQDEQRMSVYASVDIPRNTPILFNYVKPLDTTETRRRYLAEFKFFECNCKRCMDPSELGTLNSALKCTTCARNGATGAVCQSSKGTWTCATCGTSMGTMEVQSLLGRLEQVQESLRTARSEKDLRDLKSRAQELVVPSHGTVLDILQRLVRLVQPPPEPGAEDHLREKESWCRQLLEALDILDPGLSLSRGMVLFERQSNLLNLKNLLFEKDPSQVARLLVDLKMIQKMLLEAKRCIFLEKTNRSPVREICDLILAQQEELENYIEMVQHLEAN